MTNYNIYCDESCHLENDNNKSMVIGAVWCSANEKQKVFERIKSIKRNNGFKSGFEIKWNKVSMSKVDFYEDIINYFFDTSILCFRALVVPDKGVLEHDRYGQTHDEFYYKMYFDMLKIIINPNDNYNIYLDIKDTRGYEKVKKLHDVISNEKYDFSKSIINRIQEVRSDEVSILQITDLLIGALSYFHRGLKESEAKLRLIELIKKRSGYSLMQNTLPTEKKFNLFVWETGHRRGISDGSI